MNSLVLVVGLGSIGRRHLKNLRSLGVSDFVAVRSGGSPGGVPEAGDIKVADLESALAMRPRFALVCTPTRLHMESAKRIADAGCPFFLEKPLSDSMEGVVELHEVVRAKGIWTLVGFNLRFHPALRMCHTLLSQGAVGRVLYLRAEVGQYLPDWHPQADYRSGYSANRRLGGGVALDLIHEMDYTSWLAGPMGRVVCHAGRVSALEIDTEDVAEFVINFESGAMGSVHMNYLERTPSRRLRVVGERGTIAVDLLDNELQHFSIDTNAWTRVPLGPFERNDMYLEEMRHLLACAAGAETPIVDLAAAIPVHRQVIEALRLCRDASEREHLSTP